jgi:hypothetical protein
MHNIQFVPECFAETELVKVLFDNNGYLNHGEGIHNVSRILKKDDVHNYVNVGFIDNDKKNVPPYFDEFTTLEENDQLIFKKHPGTNDYVVVAKPAIERFILSQLTELGKNPSDYNLPDNFQLFRKKLKSMRIQHDEGFKTLLSDIKSANTSGIKFIMDKIVQLQNN